jgi:hypothetical protein
LLFCKAVKHYIEFLDDEIEKVFVDYMLVNLLNQATTEHIFLVLCAGYVFSLTCQGANIAGSSYSLDLLYRQLPNALTNTHFPVVGEGY